MPEIIEKVNKVVHYDIRFTEDELKFIVDNIGVVQSTHLLEQHKRCSNDNIAVVSHDRFSEMINNGFNYDLYCELKNILEK